MNRKTKTHCHNKTTSALKTTSQPLPSAACKNTPLIDAFANHSLWRWHVALVVPSAVARNQSIAACCFREISGLYDNTGTEACPCPLHLCFYLVFAVLTTRHCNITEIEPYSILNTFQAHRLGSLGFAHVVGGFSLLALVILHRT